MPNLNKVYIMGNLGSDPEMRFSGEGSPVTTFGVAVNTESRDGRITDWFQVVAFGVEAENCNKYLHKGDSVFVEGRLKTRQFEKDGENKSFTEIISQRTQFLSKLIKEEDV